LGDLQYERITVPDFRLGSIVVGSFDVTRIPAGSAQTRGLIGMDLLQNFPCSFLFDENRVALEPAESERLNELILDERQHLIPRPLAPGRAAVERVLPALPVLQVVERADEEISRRVMR
jgi:hypothetical protein